jgi:hypothetical protein
VESKTSLIRGHTPERSNFMAILNSKAQGDPILTEHLAKVNSRAKYISPEIQNEIINIIENQIRTATVDKCNASNCFALIADESTDTSTREQVSVCLRYIQRDSFSGDVSIKEDFLDFVMATSTTGEHLAELLIETLQSAGVNIAKMRAQRLRWSSQHVRQIQRCTGQNIEHYTRGNLCTL